MVFSEDKYGDRVNFLNLYIGSFSGGYTLGAYHVSGSAESGATGYYITPGGAPSLEEGSNRRVPEGEYPMTTPGGTGEWRRPGLGGPAIKRGVKIHFGYSKPVKWTQACFVISSDYSKRDGDIIYNKEQSRNQLKQFDRVLGASKIYDYQLKGKNYTRIGATFPGQLHKTISVKTLKSTWQRK